MGSCTRGAIFLLAAGAAGCLASQPEDEVQESPQEPATLHCGDEVQLGALITRVQPRETRHWAEFGLVVDDPTIRIAVESSQAHPYFLLHLVDETGKLVAGNLTDHGYEADFAATVRVGERYVLEVASSNGAFPRARGERLQVRCCEDDQPIGGRGPGRESRPCGACGWQFCLSRGAWSTDCAPHSDADCPPGAACVEGGQCSMPSDPWS